MKYLVGIILALATLMQLHNARLFNPEFGFDGRGHIEYLGFIKDNGSIPLPHLGWQYYQTPLYYLLATPANLIGGIKEVQIQNVIYYVIYVVLSGYLIGRIFKNVAQVGFLATLTLVALPVVNYLVPMISNEFANDLIMGVALLWMMIAPYNIGIVLLIVAGFYTKYTVLTLGPSYLVALLIDTKRNFSKILLYGSIFAILISPIILRNIYHYKTPLAMAESFFPFPPGREVRDLSFFTNMSWIAKRDIFTAHHYSMIGGTWNSFWHDGYRTVVPVVPFHKKALGLWLLGFPLTIISIWGWTKLRIKKRNVFIIGMTYLATAITAYILYNLHLPYPSELKAFFMSGLPIIYMLGIVGSYLYLPRLRKVILTLLLIQFGLMISYFWIAPWWHITGSFG